MRAGLPPSRPKTACNLRTRKGLPGILHSMAHFLSGQGISIISPSRFIPMRDRSIGAVTYWSRPAGTSPTLNIALRCRNTGVNGRFLRVGAYFMFARDRSLTPAAQQHLADCVAGSADIKTARALVDCEISFGAVEPAGCRITASTLPYRRGDTLDQHLTESGLTTQDRAADGTVIRRHWDITGSEGDPAVLAAAALIH
jgi:hypothetical protein